MTDKTMNASEDTNELLQETIGLLRGILEELKHANDLTRWQIEQAQEND